MKPFLNNSCSDTGLAIRDIHLPDSVLWWPFAPGWWILFLLVVLIVVGLFLYKKTFSNQKFKKNIKLELEQYYQIFNESGNALFFIQQLSAFLRRVSLYRFHDESIAKLQGTEWLEFLDSKLPASKTKKLSFRKGVGEIFLSGPYQENINSDVSQVYELVEHWLDYNLKNKHGFV